MFIAFIVKWACRSGSFLGVWRHNPQRAYIPPWSGYRCLRCGATAATAGELLRLSEEDYVDAIGRVGHVRVAFTRDRRR